MAGAANPPKIDRAVPAPDVDLTLDEQGTWPLGGYTADQPTQDDTLGDVLPNQEADPADTSKL